MICKNFYSYNILFFNSIGGKIGVCMLANNLKCETNSWDKGCVAAILHRKSTFSCCFSGFLFPANPYPDSILAERPH